MSWEHWDIGLISTAAQWVGDLALLYLKLRSRLWLRSDPWLGALYATGWPQMEKKKFIILKFDPCRANPSGETKIVVLKECGI